MTVRILDVACGCVTRYTSVLYGSPVSDSHGRCARCTLQYSYSYTTHGYAWCMDWVLVYNNNYEPTCTWAPWRIQCYDVCAKPKITVAYRFDDPCRKYASDH